jgi:hypothetical protein
MMYENSYASITFMDDATVQSSFLGHQTFLFHNEKKALLSAVETAAM